MIICEYNFQLMQKKLTTKPVKSLTPISARNVAMGGGPPHWSGNQINTSASDIKMKRVLDQSLSPVT